MVDGERYNSMREIVVCHNQVSEIQIKNIIELKQQYWSYPIESQLKWIKNNIHNDDLHVMLYDEKLLIGYLNLVKLEVEIDGVKYQANGLGNLCVDKNRTKLGLGKIMVTMANKILDETKCMGFLLCHLELVEFYKKAGWEELFCDNINIAGIGYSHKVMCYNKQNNYAQKLNFNINF